MVLAIRPLPWLGREVLVVGGGVGGIQGGILEEGGGDQRGG